jgi:hypothetical protein
MRAVMIVLAWVVLGLIMGWLIWYLPMKLAPQYTAETFIRVLPGTERPANTVAIIRQQSTLDALVDRDKIQQTKWFQNLGSTKDDRLKASSRDLKRHFRAHGLKNSDLIGLSMTCGDGDDAAVIVNEAVDLFMQRQNAAARKQIADKLVRLEEQRVRFQRDLDAAEAALDDVRRRYGFTDLEQYNYPHPITARLMRLDVERDNCALEIKQLKTRLDAFLSQSAETNLNADVKIVQAELKLLQSKFEELQRLREEAAQQEQELGVARTQSAQRQKVRDQIWRSLDSVKSRIDELKILHDDPDPSGVQFVDSAPAPLQADVLPWEIPVPAGAVVGMFVGLAHAIITKQTKR